MKKTFVFVLMIGVMIMSLAGCTKVSTQTGVKTVKIGVIAPLSGPAANYGEDMTKAYTYAVEQFNKSNKNYQIQLVVEDGKCSGKDSTSAAQKLITIDKVSYLIGGLCSTETIAASAIAKQYHMSTISPTASASEISNFGNVFRFRSDDLIGNQFGAYVSQYVKNLAIVTENTDYALGIVNNFKKSFKGTVINDIHFNTDEKDFNMIVKQLSIGKIDGLLFVGQADESIIAFFKSFMKVQGFSSLQSKIFMPYFCSSENVRTALSGYMEGIRCIDSPVVNNMNKKGQDFLTAYKKSESISAIESWIVFAKEVIDLLGNAINEGNTTPQKIEDFLRSYNESNIRKGYVGDYYFDKNGDAIGLKYVLQIIKNGQIEIIK